MRQLRLFSLLALILCASVTFGQNLFVPGGSGNIGTSSNDNIGIDISDPEAKLDVTGPAYGEARSPLFQITDNFDYTELPQGYYNNLFQIRKLAYYGGDVLLGTSDNLVIVDNEGDLGLDIDDPLHKLSINGNAFITGESSSLLFGDDLTPTWGEFGIEYMDEGLNFWKPSGNSYNGEVTNYIMFIHDNGNVGIGTSNVTDDYKLSVEGNIRARKVKVNADTWADFVFDRDYELMGLDELSSFIASNSHLPGVPSEKEVIENGIDLGDMNTVLLQKIEELTLYVIDLQKQIVDLKENNK